MGWVRPFPNTPAFPLATTVTHFDMPGIERCASPEQMPHLEPLSSQNSDSLHDSSTTYPPLPLSGALVHGSTKEKPDRDLGQLTRDVMAPLKLSLVLENKGNVARDHLASERTYLAYVRTSLACASAGVALVQLFTLSATSNVSTSAVNLDKFAKPFGATIILFGLIILVFGLVRYFTTQSALLRGYFPVARNIITMIAFVLGSLVCISFGIIVAGTQS